MGQQGTVPQAVFEKKMTWIVYMMGALVGGHASAKSNRSDTESAPTHVVNGELAGRIFRLVNLTDQQGSASEGLELNSKKCCLLFFNFLLLFLIL